MHRAARYVARALRWALYLSLVIVVVAGAGLATLGTAWGKDWLRGVIVSQANHYLTATLEVGTFEGSLLSGVRLGHVRLARDGQPLVTIDSVEVGYSVRELLGDATSIRRIRLTGVRVVAGLGPDGRWDLGALIRREAPQNGQRGAGRAIHLRSLEVIDGTVTLRSPLRLGIALLPTTYADLDFQGSFDFEPGSWRLNVARASWIGGAPDLTVKTFSGVVGKDDAGWVFNDLVVETPRSRVSVDGSLDRRVTPSRLVLAVVAERFAFQEWAGVVGFLSRIAVEGSFTATLTGPVRQLETVLDLRSNGGGVQGTFTLDTSAPGWSGTGSVALQRLDLGRWLDSASETSDISGRATFDIAMPPGARFPRGTYAFDGSHAAFKSYEGDDVVARGVITAATVQIHGATATAYGSNIRIEAGSIGVEAPYRFAFTGVADGVDLRQLPATIPVPHVESTLRFAYDVTGQFSDAHLTGRAVFQASEFLGVTLGAGAVGRIDTSTTPFSYSGEGDLGGADLHYLGDGLDIEWLQDPRYAGTVSGRFRVEGTGSNLATMTLAAEGRLTRADLFDGQLADADVTLHVDRGSLSGTFDGRLDTVDPSIALKDPRYQASLTGTGRARVEVRDLLVRSPTLNDYSISADLFLGSSTVRGIDLDSAAFSGALESGTLTVATFQATGPAVEATGSGRIELDGQRGSHVEYVVARSDLLGFESLLGRRVAGTLTTTGQLSGPTARVRLVGVGSLTHLDVMGVTALAATAHYDATIPTDVPRRASASLEATLSSVDAFGQALKDVSGTVEYGDEQATADLQLVRSDGTTGSIVGTFVVHSEEQTVDLRSLSLRIERSAWRLIPSGRSRLTWSDRGVEVADIILVDAGAGDQRLTADGTWFPAGGGELHVTAQRVSLDELAGGGELPARYGGTLDLDAIVTGSRQRPLVTGSINVADGRVGRTPFERLTGRVGYASDTLTVDLRLDQGAGVWLTATGFLPAEILGGSGSDRPMDLAIRSSTVSLGLLEGLTSVVRNISGQLEVNVQLLGTPRDPHFAGRVDVTDAGFLVVSSGARYEKGRVALQLATDRVTVETLHLEDAAGHAIDVKGELATHELRVGDLQIAVEARDFEVMDNEFGRVNLDADLALSGQFESPRLEGRIAMTGGELAVDAILDRMLFQPYATVAAAASSADAIIALNPWDRMGLGIELHVPRSVRMLGENVQVAQGTPLGLGAINLRAIGDLYLYKDPAQPMYVTGSLDSVTGTYVFQGRRFDLDPSSSINFRGDLNPELYVTVRREISSVEASVTILGPLSEPELRLSSTPPLDPSDILSLIVFNTSTSELSAGQRQQLAVRAGTLAAGFLAAPVLRGIERTLGIDTFEIEPGADASAGTRVMIGNEIAPGLVARFSRQFGELQYNEATIEYYLSRLFRIRATFSDASSLASRSPFRRVERAGIDFLVFFSF